MGVGKLPLQRSEDARLGKEEQTDVTRYALRPIIATTCPESVQTWKHNIKVVQGTKSLSFLFRNPGKNCAQDSITIASVFFKSFLGSLREVNVTSEVTGDMTMDYAWGGHHLREMFSKSKGRRTVKTAEPKVRIRFNAFGGNSRVLVLFPLVKSTIYPLFYSRQLSI